MEYLLFWLLCGSLMLNVLWVKLDIKTLESFDFWKDRKGQKEKNNYVAAFCLALICGPLTFFVDRIINGNKRPRNTEED
jgi:hypothetical protein